MEKLNAKYCKISGSNKEQKRCQKNKCVNCKRGKIDIRIKAKCNVCKARDERQRIKDIINITCKICKKFTQNQQIFDQTMNAKKGECEYPDQFIKYVEARKYCKVNQVNLINIQQFVFDFCC